MLVSGTFLERGVKMASIYADDACEYGHMILEKIVKKLKPTPGMIVELNDHNDDSYGYNYHHYIANKDGKMFFWKSFPGEEGIVKFRTRRDLEKSILFITDEESSYMDNLYTMYDEDQNEEGLFKKSSIREYFSIYEITKHLISTYTDDVPWNLAVVTNKERVNG